MLPVQTVMIRYMVLVYRWGDWWLSAVGDWEGFAGGDVTGGCARRGCCRRGCRYQNRARKGPADEGPAGPSANYGSYVFIFLNILFIVQVDFLESFAGLLVREYS